MSETKYYDKNQVLAKVLFEFIENSKDGNGTFELDPNDKEKVFIDKSKGMIIGLHTDWGGGKTTLIDDLRKDLEKDESTYFVKNVNAWQFNKEKKEDLWLSIISYFYLEILERLLQDLKNINKNDFKNFSILKVKILSIIELLKKGFINNGVKYNGIVTIKFQGFTYLSKIISELFLFKRNLTTYFKSLKSNISNIHEIKEDLNRLMSIINENNNDKHIFGPKKYVLIIDDLDRCNPKEVVNLLDALKIFLDIPNLIVIVAVDRRHIEKGIYEVYNKEQENNENLSKIHKGKYLVNPDEYLEKIIHLPIDLFLFDDDIKNPSKISQDNFKKSISDYNFQKEYKKYEYIVNLGLSNNPRKNLRFKRLFKFYFYLFSKLGLFNETESENIDFYIFLLVLKIEWGDYFQELIKKPTLLYYPFNYINNGELISELLIKYSKIFYNKVIEDLNTYEELKLKKFINFVTNFSYLISNSDRNLNNKDKYNFSNFDSILSYFYSFILGIDCFKEFISIGHKLTIKPLVDLEVFGDFDNIKPHYKESLKRIYKLNDFVEYYFEDLRESLTKSEYDKSILDKIFPELVEEYSKKNKDLITFDFNNEEENEKLISELINKKTENNKNILENLKEDEGFVEKENQLFNTNTEILDNAFPHYIKMITGIDTIQNAKEIDPKRFILGSKLFFDNILLKKFDELSKIKIDEETQLNKEDLFLNFINDTILNYKDDGLGKKHILNDLKNNGKRTFFGELINQMSFAKGGPSIGGMTGATDYTQLEAIVIEGIEDKNVLKEWQEILKKTIFIEGGVSLVKHVMKFKQMIEFLHENIKDENLLKRLNRLEKRLIYIFSHFWSFQKIDLYIPYYGTSKKGLKLLGLWENIYGNLDNSLSNYITFCMAFNNYKEKYISSLGEGFDKELDEYIGKTEHNLETLFKGNDIRIDKEYAKNFIKVKIIEHRLIRLLEFKEQQEKGNNQDTN